MSDFTPDDHIHAFFDSWNALRRLLSRIDPFNPNMDIGEVVFNDFLKVLRLIEMHAGLANNALQSVIDDDSEGAVLTEHEAQASRFTDCNIKELKLLSELLLQKLLVDQSQRSEMYQLCKDVSRAFRIKKESMETPP